MQFQSTIPQTNENYPPLLFYHVAIGCFHPQLFSCVDFVVLTLIHSLTRYWQGERAAMVMIQMCYHLTPISLQEKQHF